MQDTRVRGVRLRTDWVAMSWEQNPSPGTDGPPEGPPRHRAPGPSSQASWGRGLESRIVLDLALLPVMSAWRLNPASGSEQLLALCFEGTRRIWLLSQTFQKWQNFCSLLATMHQWPGFRACSCLLRVMLACPARHPHAKLSCFYRTK